MIERMHMAVLGGVKSVYAASCGWEHLGVKQKNFDTKCFDVSVLAGSSVLILTSSTPWRSSWSRASSRWPSCRRRGTAPWRSRCPRTQSQSVHSSRCRWREVHRCHPAASTRSVTRRQNGKEKEQRFQLWDMEKVDWHLKLV